jgi:signal transduction histidine kinase
VSAEQVDDAETGALEHGELVVALRPEPVAPIVLEVSQIYAPQAQEAGLTMELAVPPPESVVECDRDRLLQVLGNLVGNALKFTPEGGRIVVRATDRVDAVRFEVEDNGAGIKPEHLPHIFERFASYDAGGTGLGLFIVKSIVGAHRGDLAVRSAPGQGSTFSFEIPRRASAGTERKTRSLTSPTSA